MEEILHQAEQLEKEYDWSGATESYEKALRLLPSNDFSRMGEISERLGYAFHRAAMQTDSQEEFRKRMRLAIEAYEGAHKIYERLMDTEKTARMFRCKAVTKYLGYWLTIVPSEKRKLLDECLELAKNASTVFWDLNNKLEFARTYNELSLVFWFRIFLAEDGQTLKAIAERGIEWGEKTLEAISGLGDQHEIAKTYFTLATCWDICESFIEDPEEQGRISLKIVKYLNETVSISEKVGDVHLEGLAHILLGGHAGEEEGMRHFKKTLKCGKITRDNFLIGMGLDYMAFQTNWSAAATEEPDKKRGRARFMKRLCDCTMKGNIISL